MHLRMQRDVWLDNVKNLRYYEGCSGSSWNLVIKVSNIDIILSFFDIAQVDINELSSRS